MNSYSPKVKGRKHLGTHRAGVCRVCMTPGLRRSKLRGKDVFRMVLLQIPVRCMECRKRQFGWVWKAVFAVPASMAHAGAFQTDETWQDYTDSAPVRGSHEHAGQDRNAA